MLVYSGDKDFICNWRGGEKWTHEANWTHTAEFQKAPYVDWTGTNSTSNATVKWGEYKSVDKLTFLRVYDAGHMVPMDQPEAALNMLDRFFGNWHRERMARLARE